MCPEAEREGSKKILLPRAASTEAWSAGDEAFGEALTRATVLSFESKEAVSIATIAMRASFCRRSRPRGVE
jgi:hypothetical protein